MTEPNVRSDTESDDAARLRVRVPLTTRRKAPPYVNYASISTEGLAALTLAFFYIDVEGDPSVPGSVDADVRAVVGDGPRVLEAEPVARMTMAVNDGMSLAMDLIRACAESAPGMSAVLADSLEAAVRELRDPANQEET